MTSVVQPMDQRIIKNLNNLYRRLLVEYVLIEDCDALKITLDILQASRMCKKAWDKVMPETIKHCFKKSGFVKKEDNAEKANDIIAEAVHSVDGWEDVITDPASKRAAPDPAISFEDFVKVDEDVAVCGEIIDAEIIA
ncbi:uncharacterized protein LOC124371014 [Homalodisca vitripennis]|uniref:uncharacterized protein LOC124371014 n=1 Tax=Homalodisca vitripennis TaxID=197043 RepID=UPI001EEC89E2|nr:uncharacterized protein LOC124371014 [Homalodisca vitripennis]